jgi:hypothetical protein
MSKVLWPTRHGVSCKWRHTLGTPGVESVLPNFIFLYFHIFAVNISCFVTWEIMQLLWNGQAQYRKFMIQQHLNELSSKAVTSLAFLLLMWQMWRKESFAGHPWFISWFFLFWCVNTRYVAQCLQGQTDFTTTTTKVGNLFFTCSIYNQTCVQRKPAGPKICSYCWQEVVVQR